MSWHSILASELVNQFMCQCSADKSHKFVPISGKLVGKNLSSLVERDACRLFLWNYLPTRRHTIQQKPGTGFLPMSPDESTPPPGAQHSEVHSDRIRDLTRGQKNDDKIIPILTHHSTCFERGCKPQENAHCEHPWPRFVLPCSTLLAAE